MVTKKRCFGCKKFSSIKLSYTTRVYCNTCFTHLMERKVRKDIRINKKITKSKEIKLLNNNSKEFKVAKIILQNMFGDFAKIISVKKADKKTLVPTNADIESKKYLESYLQNKKTTKHNNNLILNNILEEEIINFCKIKRIKINKKELKNELLESIEKKHPDTKFGIIRSFKKINNL